MTIELRVQGRRYQRWKAIRITAGLEDACRDFELPVTELYPGGENPLLIMPDSACEVFLEGERVCTGYTDGIRISANATSHEILVTGRSTTQDAVDCSPETPGVLKGLTVDAIARQLLAPYGIGLVVEVDTGAKIPKLVVEASETVYDAINRAAITRGLLVTDDARGRLVLTRANEAARANSPLTVGDNVLNITADFSAKDLFSDYICRGQNAGSDVDFGARAALVSGTATDSLIRRKRIKRIDAERRLTIAQARERAQWEANNRIAKAITVDVTVAGWRDEKGRLWTPNTVVTVTDPLSRIDSFDMLITEAKYQIGDSEGQLTTLKLQPPLAYQLFKPTEQRKRRKALAGIDKFRIWKNVGDTIVLWTLAQRGVAGAELENAADALSNSTDKATAALLLAREGR